MRIIYNSPRFSEDLDFNSAFIDYSGIEKVVLDTLTHMEKEKIKFSIEEGNPTTGGFFAVIAFSGFAQPVRIKIEISQRPEEKRGGQLLWIDLKKLGILTPGTKELSKESRDKKDNKFLICAGEAQAHYIVTSDKDLLDLNEYENAKIIPPQNL